MNGCMKTLNRSRHHGVLLTVSLKAGQVHNVPCLSDDEDEDGKHKHSPRSKQHSAGIDLDPDDDRDGIADADADDDDDEMRSPLSAQATQGASSQSSDKQTALYYATLDAHIANSVSEF